MDTQTTGTEPVKGNPFKSRTPEELKQIAQAVLALDKKDRVFVGNELVNYAIYSAKACDSLDEKDPNILEMLEFIGKRIAYWTFQQALIDGTYESGRTIESYRKNTNP